MCCRHGLQQHTWLRQLHNEIQSVFNRRHKECVAFVDLKNGFLIRDSADFKVERNAKPEKVVCNLGNLANTFEVAASKQLLPFVLVDQAQRLDTGLAEKFRLIEMWYL